MEKNEKNIYVTPVIDYLAEESIENRLDQLEGYFNDLIKESNFQKFKLLFNLLEESGTKDWGEISVKYSQEFQKLSDGIVNFIKNIQSLLVGHPNVNKYPYSELFEGKLIAKPKNQKEAKERIEKMQECLRDRFKKRLYSEIYPKYKKYLDVDFDIETKKGKKRMNEKRLKLRKEQIINLGYDRGKSV